MTPVEPAFGVCEVIVYSDDHHASLATVGQVRVRLLMEVWAQRTAALGARDGIGYVMPFENKGDVVGVTLSHPHGQIFGFPDIPPRPLRELQTARAYHGRHGRCVWCDLVAQETAGPRVVAESGRWLAVVPFWARWPYQVEIWARGHDADLVATGPAGRRDLAAVLTEVLGAYDGLFGFSLPYVLGVHQRPTDGGDWDAVAHVHLELDPPHRSAEKLKFLAGTETIGGAFLTDVAPEAAAARLRAAGSAGAVTDVAARAAARFTAWRGRPPEGLWAAPGRVNLIGEHLDYNGGHVLPFATDRVTVVAVARHTEPVLRCASAQQAEPVEVPLDALRHASGWVAYVAGTVWASAELGVSPGGADVYVDSDLPMGSGLASSAALGCAVGAALGDLAGAPLDRTVLARAAQRAESVVAGAPVGIMDQMASLFGRRGHALYLDTASLAVEQLPLPIDGAPLELLAVDTGRPHAHATGEYVDRRRACEDAARRLGVTALASVSPAELAAAALPGELARRARHVVSEQGRTRLAAAALRAGDLGAVGPLMTASHRSMQHDFEITTPELDAVVDAALAAGALGARMTGGGFGGTAIFLVPAVATPEVRAAVTAALAPDGRPAPEVRRERAAAGAARIG